MQEEEAAELVEKRRTKREIPNMFHVKHIQAVFHVKHRFRQRRNRKKTPLRTKKNAQGRETCLFQTRAGGFPRPRCLRIRSQAMPWQARLPVLGLYIRISLAFSGISANTPSGGSAAHARRISPVRTVAADVLFFTHFAAAVPYPPSPEDFPGRRRDGVLLHERASAPSCPSRNPIARRAENKC